MINSVFKKSFFILILVNYLFNLSIYASCNSSVSVKANQTAFLEGIIEKKVLLPSIQGGNTNKIDKIWTFSLTHPINIFDSDLESEICDQKILQLVLSQEQYLAYKNYIGKLVLVKGQAFSGISAHHYTKALIFVEKIESVMEKK